MNKRATGKILRCFLKRFQNRWIDSFWCFGGWIDKYSLFVFALGIEFDGQRMTEISTSFVAKPSPWCSKWLALKESPSVFKLNAKEAAAKRA